MVLCSRDNWRLPFVGVLAVLDGGRRINTELIPLRPMQVFSSAKPGKLYRASVVEATTTMRRHEAKKVNKTGMGLDPSIRVCREAVFQRKQLITAR